MKRSSVPSKPYFFIDLPGRVNRSKGDGYKTFTISTGLIDFDIKVISEYIHVGSGSYESANNDWYYTFFRSKNQIMIPGSSIKGAVRAVAEAISSSCVSTYSIKEKDYLYKNKNRIKCSSLNNLCPVCRIFGTTGYSGKIYFTDAPLLSGQIEKNVQVGNLYSPRRIFGRKFYHNKTYIKPQTERGIIPLALEAVKKDSIFKTTLSFQNLKDEELSLILHSMGINQDYKIKIGGAKPRCFGTVEITPTKIRLIDFNKDRMLSSNTPFYEKDLEWIKKIMGNRNLIQEDFFNKFSMNSKIETGECPAWNY
ncbi:MAG: RAMP superfamily CRISPR-associated protein [Candidatus Odinarchaeum yellowstonii]|uniref:RAMP superfamily CRISPR-associated protein n=1 Tax=Odinarchaeota yellowstonii (strain LCB_4) TaxID=1841599 RepID=A0AAF0IBD7_ODILC|nr:MAG: RAMP superfamily CRISPR-associated protein [Candidatus Odinarchaeum yellowstonii]